MLPGGTVLWWMRLLLMTAIRGGAICGTTGTPARRSRTTRGTPSARCSQLLRELVAPRSRHVPDRAGLGPGDLGGAVRDLHWAPAMAGSAGRILHSAARLPHLI